jgi:rod shape determining protein RodA
MFHLRWLKRLDWWLLGVALALAGLGLVMIYSATRANVELTGGNPMVFMRRQAVWLLVSLVAMAAIIYVDYRTVMAAYRPVYGVCLALLALVLVVGHAPTGATSWFALGPLRGQPSEFAKLGLAVALASYASRHLHEMRRLRPFLVSLLVVGGPALLVFAQPDLGTALVLVAMWAAVVYVAGARGWYLAGAVALGLLMAAMMWQADLLKPYQKARLAVFLNPQSDPLGAGYHIIQSKIAIGSGGLVGRGLFHGTQSQLQFIPERHTDFIFSVVGEELGLVGALAVVALYTILLLRGLAIVRQTTDPRGALLAVAIVAMLAFHIIVNVGMTISIMPVTGLPLPLLSYGGSNLLTTLLGLGLLLNVGMRRQSLVF